MNRWNWGRTMLVVAAAAGLGGCGHGWPTGVAGKYPLTVQDRSDAEFGPALAKEIVRQSRTTRAFRGARDRDSAIITMHVDRMVPAQLRDGSDGYTYLVSWQRGGVPFGQQEGDCHHNDFKRCALDAVSTMYQTVRLMEMRQNSGQ